MNNRDIDDFILQGEFEIDYNYGLSELAYYKNELTFLRAGAKYSDLGIGNRRHELRPGIIKSNGHIIRESSFLKDSNKTPSQSFAYIRLEGIMRSKDSASTPGINSITDSLQAAQENKNITGVLIEANTGGGESLAGQILKSALEEFTKPVVGYIHFLASAGYLGLLPVNELVASGKMTKVGSLGSYVSLNRSFKQWYKSNFQDIYADKSNNKNREFRSYIVSGRKVIIP